MENKNLFVVPTDKPSRLIFDKEENRYLPLQEVDFWMEHQDLVENQNIYITSDEALPYDSSIFDNGAFYHRDTVGDVHIITKHTFKPNPHFCKRIILTTDQDLIKYGIQAIDDEFLEWFVKNPSCEKVYTSVMKTRPRGSNDEWKVIYKIIIPKEEVKQELEKEMFELEQELDIPSHLRWHNSKPKQRLEKYSERFDNKDNEIVEGIFNPDTWGKRLVDDEPKQETLEEVAEKYVNSFEFGIAHPRRVCKNAFINGAKWQQVRMYTEEEVIAFGEFIFKHSLLTHTRGVKSLFEQFKKK